MRKILTTFAFLSFCSAAHAKLNIVTMNIKGTNPHVSVAALTTETYTMNEFGAIIVKSADGQNDCRIHQDLLTTTHISGVEFYNHLRNLAKANETFLLSCYTDSSSSGSAIQIVITQSN